jgi:hypothetical protein
MGDLILIYTTYLYLSLFFSQQPIPYLGINQGNYFRFQISGNIFGFTYI